MLNNIYKEVADSLGYDERIVKEVFYYTFDFIKNKIEELELKDTNYTEDEFRKLRTSFNLPRLGKLGCTYKNYTKLVNSYKRKRDDKNDKRKADDE